MTNKDKDNNKDSKDKDHKYTVGNLICASNNHGKIGIIIKIVTAGMMESMINIYWLAQHKTFWTNKLYIKPLPHHDHIQ